MPVSPTGTEEVVVEQEAVGTLAHPVHQAPARRAVPRLR